jgi:signal transduction histidine kinase
MTAEQAAIERVVRWRFDGFWARLGQAAVVAPLAWLVTGSWLAGAWFAAAASLGALDAWAFKRLHERPDSLWRRRLALGVLALSTSAFASVGLLLFIKHSPVSLAGALLILCAINLNNAVMSRGWPAASRVSIATSGTMIVGAPLAAMAYGVSLSDGLILAAGALTYIVFIGLLVATLNREGEVLQRALESQEHQRDYVRQAKEGAERAQARWSMLFDQSSLPQVCFDGSRLHEVLQPAIAAGETRLGDALARSVGGVGDALARLTLTEANAASEALFGVTRFNGAMDSQHFDASFLKGFCEALNGLDAQGVFPPFDARVIRGDGEAVDVAVHIRTIPGSERPWSTCIATYVDVTDQRRAERAQREAVAAAEAANHAKSEFLAIMSHEIRTPLNGVLGMTQAMGREKMSKTQRERLAVIGQSGAALLAILNDILDLSKIEAGKLELEAAEFDLGLLAEGAHAAYRDLAEKKGLEFVLSVADEAEGTYLGDSVRVRQVLYNLISNAVKFTDQGGEIDVSAEEKGDFIQISVRDTGPGLAPEEQARVFEAFYQADTSNKRTAGGTGLGLAICRGIIVMHGGQLNVASEKGKGAVFSFIIPRRRSQKAA